MINLRNRAWLALTVAALVCSSTRAQTTLYSHSFGGSGGLLNGVAVDVSNSSSSSWLANSAFLDNGATDGTLSGSALLDLTLQANASYSLSVDITPGAVDGDWGGFGFASGSAADFIGAPGADGGNDDRFTDGPGGQAWALIRDIDGALNAGDVEFFGGPGTGGGTLSDGALDIVAGVTYSLEILLTTAADGASYTADLLIDGASRTGGPVTINNAIASIGSVGLTFNNTIDPGHVFDNFLLTEQVIGAPTNLWDVDGGGSFQTAGNWSEGVVPSSTATFGASLSAANSPGVVTLNAATTLQEVRFTNPDASYTLAGPSALTLNGSASVDATAGEHTISAVIQGSAGLNKGGAGTLILSADNTYSGATNVNAGALRVMVPGAVDGVVSVAAGASFGFQGDGQGGGFSGAFGNAISGAGGVVLSNTLTTETVTFGAAKSYSGNTAINGGTLAISNGGALGAADGTAAAGTVLGGNESTGKLALSGGISVGDEVLTLGARENAALDAVHLTSSGSNSWAGAVKGVVGGTQYNIESTSGTLTLGGVISAPDNGTRNFVFSGAGNTTISGMLTDYASDDDGVLIDADLNGDPDTNAVDNVNLIKRGSGTLTIATGTDTETDFHHGATVVEEGTLVVSQGGGDTGELWSSEIQVRSGAQFNVFSFSEYNLQEGQALGGAGVVQASTLGVFSDNILTPGDNGRGTLSVTGNVALSNLGVDGRLNFELGDATTVGGTENDLIAVSGNLSGTLTSTVSVTPVEGQLATGSYRLFTHNSGGAPSVNGMQRQVVDNLGNVLNPRQTFTVSATSSQVNLNVAGSRATLTWNGTAGSNAWDVATSNNWSGGASDFRDLDAVTFGSGGVKDVVVNSTVSPGSVTFNGGAGSTYTLTGVGGMTGYGPVNVNSGTVRLFNTGNAFAGTTTVASGARLEMSAGTYGGIVVNGVLEAVNNTVVTLIDDFEDTSLAEYSFFKILDQGTVTNTSFESPAGVLANTSAGADGAEQALLFRNDFQLAVGEELRVNAPLDTFVGNDLGLAIGEAPTDLGNGSSGDVRTNGDYLFISFRADTQLNSRGFNGGAEVGQVQGFGVNADQLFIARTGEDTVELGWYDGVTRNVLRAETVASTDIFDNIGFYGDLRADGAGYSGLDDLRFQVGAEDLTLNVDGDLTLNSAGVLEFEISDTGLADIAAAGTATLDGVIDVSLATGFTPNEGSQYTILSAAEGIATALGSLDFGAGLPAGFTAAYNDALTELILTFGAGLAGDFNGDGVVNAADYTVWRDNQGADEGDLLAGNGTGGVIDGADYDLWRTNYGRSTAAPASAAAAAPEPTALALLLTIGGAACVRVRTAGRLRNRG